MLSEQTLHIDKNSKCDIITLSDKLRERGFEEVDYVYEPGQFAVRGSILDVFSYTNELPYRIDFFGKEVESIRTFEVETQLSTQKIGRSLYRCQRMRTGSLRHLHTRFHR